MQVPRKRHPGWAFPGHALLHSSAESTRRRRDFLESGAPTVLLVPPKSPLRLPVPIVPPSFSPPAGILHKVRKRKKEEAETSEKRPNLIPKPPQAPRFWEPLVAPPAPLSVQPVGLQAERTPGSTPWLSAPARGQGAFRGIRPLPQLLRATTGTQPCPTAPSPAPSP